MSQPLAGRCRFCSNTAGTLQLAMGTPEQSTINTAAEAFAAVALAAVACDGELAAVEARSLRQQLEFRVPFRTYSEWQHPCGTWFMDGSAQRC